MGLKSIRWRFVFIYFLLILSVVLILFSSITTRLENSLVNDKIKNISDRITQMLDTTYFKSDSLDENIRGIQASLIRRFQNDEDIYIISSEDFTNLLAVKSSHANRNIGQNAYTLEELKVELIQNAYRGNFSNKMFVENGNKQHLVFPILSQNNKVSGVLYAILHLDSISDTLNRVKRIMLDAFIFTLIITIIFSFILASGITGPIRQATEVAKKMRDGDFSLKLQVKSNDEIGRLAEMFNMMSMELDRNIKYIKRESNKLDTIFSHMQEALLAIDQDKNIIHINPMAKEVFGVCNEKTLDAANLSLDDIGLINVNIKNPYSIYGENFITRDDKTYKAIFTAFDDENLDTSGILIIYQDMTKEKHLEDMRRDFIANVSHELKTPITGIKAYAETLMNMDLDAETRNNFLKVINDESDRMAHIVRDLLTLSTLDNVVEEKKKELVNITDITKNAVMRQKMIIKEKNQSIHEYYQDDLFVYTNKEDILQVIINLISNANKYTNEGGVIKVETYKKGSSVMISVEDNGIGIPKADLDKIFERFYRVEKSRSRSMGGTGLGLSIAQKMIETLGGKILVESELNKGSKFTIVLDDSHEKY